MKTRSRVLAATVAGAMMLFTLTGCSNNDKVSLASTQTAVPTAIPTAVAEAPVVSLVANNGTNESQMPTLMIGLDPTQRNSISMLNHLAVLTQEINASQNSRLYLEEAYSSLINNTYPNAVDNRTLSQLTNILDTLEKYRMIAVKRDRLEYVYEQNRAEALRSAVPSPLGLMSAVQSFNLAKLAASVVYMAVDSATSYASASAQADMQYLQDGWVLDDEAASALHNSRKDTFSYMVSIVGDYSLPGDLALSEGAVEEFVEWENNSNVVQRIQFLESNRETYQALGTYWIVLAESYYENGQFDKCLSAVASYEALDVQIFRNDYEYARVLPLAVIAAGEVLAGDQYVTTVERYLGQIMSNTDYSDWVSHYFAAQAYVELYSRTGKQVYLEKAYDVVVDNVNGLVNVQRELNAEYLAPVKAVEAPKDATKAEKADISNYNKLLKEERKTELPPVYEPLLLNCELLFSLAEELDIPAEKKQLVESILHGNGECIFLSTPIDDQFRFESTDAGYTELTISFDGKKLVLPASLVSDGSVITVTVIPAEGETVTFNDWVVSKVDRKEESNLASFEVTYQSAAADEYKYAAGATISIDVSSGISETEPIHYEYVTTAEKTLYLFNAVGFKKVEE